MAVLQALLEPFADPAARTFWVGLLVSGGIALVVGLVRFGPAEVVSLVGRGMGDAFHRSSRLDAQLFVARQLLGLLFVAPAVGGSFYLATHLVRGLDASIGPPGWTLEPSIALGVLYSVTLFVTWDLSRYVLHRLMHEVPFLWELHQVHHSAQILTPLTFHRMHPLESALYLLRGVVVTGVVGGGFYWACRGAEADLTLLGVNAFGFLANVATGNLRHSHVWLRFPAGLERWWISPAQHQLHHSIDPVQQSQNYGTWLAVWDRAFGTLALAPATPPDRYGVADRNHADHLLSAWFAPLWAMLRRGGPGGAGVLLLPLLASDAEAQDDGADKVDPSMEVIVYSEDGVPRAAGSAHVVTEEELELFEFDDIHEVLATVPGVYVRGEDGFGLRPNIGIRGASSDRSAKITLLEDGVLLAPAPYAAPAAYYFPMTTRMVAVEVFKGPAATQHGPHTVGGAINMVTRPVPDHPLGSVDLAVGLRQTLKLHGWGGTQGPRWGVLLEGVHLQTAGFKELDTGGNTGFDRDEVMAKVRFDALELKLGYAAETSNETYLGLHVDDYEATPHRRYAASANDLMHWDRTQIALSHEGRASDALAVRTTAYHHFLTRAWTKLNRFAGGPDLHDLLLQPEAGQSAVYLAILRGEEDSVTPDQTLQIGTNDRTYHSFGVQTRGRWKARAGAVGSTLELGARIHGDDVVRNHTEDPFQMRDGELQADTGPTTSLLDTHTTALALAGHIHEDLELGPLRVLPGARIEVIRTTADGVADRWRAIPLPGLGLHGAVAPGLDVFAGAHRGFSPVAPGQPEEVEPESSVNIEGGLRAGRGGPRAELVGYFNDYTNLVGSCTFSGGCTGDQVDQQFNGGNVFVYGAEAVVGHDWMLPAHLSVPIEFTYTLTQSSFRTSFVSGFPQFGSVTAGDALPYVPQHQGSARATLVGQRIRLGVAGTARSGMLDEAGTFPLPDGGIPASAQLDVATQVQATDMLELYGTWTNATATRAVISHRPFGARPPAPMQVMVGARIQEPVRSTRYAADGR